MSERGLHRRRRPRRPVLRLRPREASTTTSRSWQYEPEPRGRHRGGHRDRATPPSSAGEHQPSGNRRRARRRQRRGRRPGRARAGRHAAAPALASSRSSSGTSPATPPRWCRGLRHRAGDVRAGRPAVTANSNRDRTTAWVYSRGLDAAHASGRSTSATALDPADRCWATSGAPAAGSWRCAGTPASRGPPTSRRCSTSCRATSRCRTRCSTRRSTSYLAAAAGKAGFWGNMPARTWSACSRPGGVTRRRPENDFCFDYLPKINRRPQLLPDDRRHDRGEGARATSSSGRTRRSGSPNGRMKRFGLANLDWLVVRDLHDDRVRHLLDGLARRSRPVNCAPRDIGTEVFFMPAASHTEKNGTLHQDAADAPVARPGREPTDDSAQRPLVLLPPGPDHARAADGLHRRARPPAAAS